MAVENLFVKGELRSLLENQHKLIQREVDTLDENYLLNISEGDLIEQLVKKYTIIPPSLKVQDKYSLAPKEIDIDVSRDFLRDIRDRSRPFYIKGTKITVVIPFEGEHELFRFNPAIVMGTGLYAEILEHELRLEYQVTRHDPDSLSRNIENDISRIESYLSRINNAVDSYSASLGEYVQSVVKRRKDKLLKDRDLLSALNIPIKKDEAISKTYALPIKQKSIIIELPKTKTEKYQPEPILDMAIYEDILKIMDNMTMVMERSPHAFIKMNEENLRDHFLVQLNGQYKGQAMGEVFNYQGKTDILIRYKEKNAFIAECKFWAGKKKLIETIDQLLGYISWRDTKTAILVFNRNKNLSEILQVIPGIIESHPNYKRTISIEGETRFRYIFHQHSDNNREIILTVMVFDIPKI
jgi:hypothetical protein